MGGGGDPEGGWHRAREGAQIQIHARRDFIKIRAGGFLGSITKRCSGSEPKYAPLRRDSRGGKPDPGEPEYQTHSPPPFPPP